MDCRFGQHQPGVSAATERESLNNAEAFMYRVTFISGNKPVSLSVRCSQEEALGFAEWLEEGLGFVVLTVKEVR